MTFAQLPVERANGLINHGPTVLVTSKYQEKANIMFRACFKVTGQHWAFISSFLFSIFVFPLD